LQNFLSCDVENKPLLMRLIKNKIFGFLTFGIYRFWGKTHLRRLLWQSIRIGDDRLTYHGTVKELFIGFLIAVVVLIVVLGGIGTGLGVLAVAAPIWAPVAELANFVLLYSFWQFARYRLWRYRLSRTSFRTIRFFQKGSAFKYAGLVLLWTSITLLTVGWAFPKLRAVQLDYRFNNMSFGATDFSYRGKTSDLYGIYWPLIVVGMLLSGIGGVLYFQYDFFGAFETQEGSNVIVNPTAFWTFFSASAVCYLGVGLYYFVCRINELKYLLGKLGFGDANFTTSLSVGKITGVLVRALLMIIFALAVTVAVFQLGAGGTLGGFGIILVIAALLVFVSIDIFFFFYVYVPLLKVMCDTTKIDNPRIFEEVAAGSFDAPKYGEGFADALDVGAF
jgi:uncharacterized membrane protein YjgN (DUF898 family)